MHVIKKITTALFVIFFLACANGSYGIAGIVQRIERGKDGYTAIMLTKNGDSVSAVFSKVDMGAHYRELSIGDNAIVIGDTMHLEHEIVIKARKIE